MKCQGRACIPYTHSEWPPGTLSAAGGLFLFFFVDLGVTSMQDRLANHEKHNAAYKPNDRSMLEGSDVQRIGASAYLPVCTTEKIRSQDRLT